MLVYLLLALVSVLSPRVSGQTVGIASTTGIVQTVALPTGRDSFDHSLYLSEVEVEVEVESKASVDDVVANVSTPSSLLCLDLLLADCFSARPPVNSAGLPSPLVTATAITILHRAFRI